MECSGDPNGYSLTLVKPSSPPSTQSQTDSFLTAARLAREGLLEDGRTGQQFSTLRQSPSSSQENHGAVLKDLRIRRYTVISRRKTETDRKTDNGEGKQTPQGASSPKSEAERQKVCLSASDCRFTCRQPGRFKVAVLPVIAEI